LFKIVPSEAGMVFVPLFQQDTFLLPLAAVQK